VVLGWSVVGCLGGAAEPVELSTRVLALAGQCLHSLEVSVSRVGTRLGQPARTGRGDVP